MNKKIIVNDLSVCYGNNNRALSNINIEILEHEFIGVVGANGSGKSTLIKAILGLVPLQKGTVIINEPSDKIGYVPQFSQMNTSFPITLLEAVCLGMIGKGLHPFKYLTADNQKKAMEKLKLLKIDSLADRQLTDLSGGEFQRMLIARALALEPNILILDEPTASIDSKSREMIYNLLHELSKTITIILISHDLEEVLKLSTKILCLNNKVTYFGPSNITINDINNYEIQ